MAHYAFVNEDNIVTEVIVGKEESELEEGIVSWEDHYSSFREGVTCIRTSYNTWGGVHSGGGEPLRKNFASVGFTYDQERDAFIPPQPFASWLLNEETCLWEAPVAYPEDGNIYSWNEETTSWIEVTE